MVPVLRFKEELRLEKEEAKLNEKQDLVLTFVNGLEKPNPTDALTVNKEFADIYLEKDGKNKNGHISKGSCNGGQVTQ